MMDPITIALLAVFYLVLAGCVAFCAIMALDRLLTALQGLRTFFRWRARR